MKFIIYLYYLIYKVTYRFEYFFYDHSPLTPKDKSKRKKVRNGLKLAWIFRLHLFFYWLWIIHRMFFNTHVYMWFYANKDIY